MQVTISITMNTEKPPRKPPEKEEYSRSDSLKTIQLPPPEPFRSLALRLKDALSRDDKKEVQNVCKLLIDELSIAYGVSKPTIKVLSVRPREEGDKWVFETFGDYDPETLKNPSLDAYCNSKEANFLWCFAQHTVSRVLSPSRYGLAGLSEYVPYARLLRSRGSFVPPYSEHASQANCVAAAFGWLSQYRLGAHNERCAESSCLSENLL